MVCGQVCCCPVLAKAVVQQSSPTAPMSYDEKRRLPKPVFLDPSLKIPTVQHMKRRGQQDDQTGQCNLAIIPALDLSVSDDPDEIAHFRTNQGQYRRYFELSPCHSRISGVSYRKLMIAVRVQVRLCEC